MAATLLLRLPLFARSPNPTTTTMSPSIVHFPAGFLPPPPLPLPLPPLAPPTPRLLTGSRLFSVGPRCGPPTAPASSADFSEFIARISPASADFGEFIIRIVYVCMFVVSVCVIGAYIRSESRSAEESGSLPPGEQSGSLLPVSLQGKSEVKVTILMLILGIAFAAHMMLSGPGFSSDRVEAMTKFVGPGLFLIAKLVKAVWLGKLLDPEILFVAFFLSLVHIPMIYYRYIYFRVSACVETRILTSYVAVMGYLTQVWSLADALSSGGVKTEKKVDWYCMLMQGMVVFICLSCSIALCGR